jgi:para-nitrobenzyl esterase
MNSALRFLAGAAMFGATVAVHAQMPDKVDAPAGRISGTQSTANANVVSFLGIPYAAPPVEENRWRAPQPADMDRNFKAEAYGNQCQQRLAAGLTPGQAVGRGGGFTGQFGGGGFGGGGFGGGGFGGAGRGGAGGFGPQGSIITSEDCLYLNVWSGAESVTAKRPVMVWVHGDQFLRGTGSDSRYIGEFLASRGIVVVNFNYRLGTFGFLAHPLLTAEAGSSGNYGLMDAIAALQWVKNNIEAFGGDPGNITVFSGSYGAVMTAALIGSPAAEGLFQRAILQSGSWMGMGLAPMQTLAEAEQVGTEQLARFGTPTLEDLRELSVDELLGVLPEPKLIIDGKLIPEDLAATFAAGRQNPVDVIVGSNREEGVVLAERSTVRTFGEYEAAIRARFGALADDFLRIYPSGANDIAISSYVTALGDEMAWQMRLLAAEQTALGNKAHVYEFTRVPPSSSTQQSRGATHGSEVQYVFTTMGQFQAWTDGDRRLAQVMASYWINFAETGSPEGVDRWEGVELPEWPAYTGSEEFQTMEFGDRIGTNPIWVIAPEKLELFDRAYPELVPAGG